MAHHLNTNKQFMIGNGILAFAVIFVVVIFVYMSMRLQRQKEGERYFAETYNVTLVKGFTGDSISILLNDSVLIDQRIDTGRVKPQPHHPCQLIGTAAPV